MLNNVGHVMGGSKKDRDNMGGIWTSKAAKGTHGIGAVGNVSIDEEGRQVHDEFLDLLMEVRVHDHYNELKNRSKEAWTTYESQYTRKRRKTNAVTRSTVAPTFNLLGSLQVPVDTRGLQGARLRNMLNIDS